MAKVGMKEMLEAGAHFGHQTRRWNPKMQKFIFGPRNGIHIIDLQQTVGLFEQAYKFVADLTAKGGKVLFVGTKKQAQEIIKEEASRCKQFYINNRWLGGTLTNFRTIKLSVDRMTKLEAMAKDGTFEKLPKKEVFGITRELEKLEKNLGGIRDMNKIPRAIFIVDPKKESIAVEEALKLALPIVATVDTNCNPDVINYPVPANDDSIRSIKLFVSKMAEACIEGSAKWEEELLARKAKGDVVDTKEEHKKEDKKTKAKKGPTVEVIHSVAGNSTAVDEKVTDKQDSAIKEEETASEVK